MQIPAINLTRAIRRKVYWLIALGLFFALSSVANATNRIALVIGNANYPDMPLDNPRNDATAMQHMLEKAGFEVISALDADLKTMQNAMLKFVGKLNTQSTALVFYAGHGMQANGRNYLLPVDASIKSEKSLRFESLELGDLLEELDHSNARIKMVILDACRNNPFERSMRGGSRGLAAVDAARGTLIAYATAPGSTASDGDGENGLYTQSLLQALAEPGLKVEEVFKKVRIAVADASSGAQIPWESSSLTGDFVFFEHSDSTSTPSTKPHTTNAITQTTHTANSEFLFWQSVKDSGDSEQLNAYLARYPKGEFSELATLKIKQLAVVSPAVDSKPAATSSRPLVLKSSCDDLSGEWHNEPQQNAACAPPRLNFTRTGDKNYQVAGSGCAVPLSGTAYHETPSKLIVHWKMATCKGVTTHQLNADCTAGSGQVKVHRHLLCLVGDSTEEIRRVDSSTN